MGKNKKKNKKTSTINSLSNTKYDKVLSPIIEDIYIKCVKLDHEETKALNKRFGEVIGSFVEKMKEVDITFKEIFERIGYTGSFYDDLRITEATEFDLNLILKPNFHMDLLWRKRPPGFVGIRVFPSLNTLYGPYKDWIFKSDPDMDFLNPNAVRSWLQGVVERTINKIKEEKTPFFGCKLKLRQSGPACTLSVMSQFPPSKTIDIDLVPVLEFSSVKRGISPIIRSKQDDIRKVGLEKPWFAVPKPPAANCPCNMCISWRTSFPIQESDIIEDLNFFKYTLRMIKRVRDELGIHEVASYYIKTLFLLELQKKGPEMFVRCSRGLLFMHMLESLRKALENGFSARIPYIWNQDCNLLGKVSRETLTNKAGQLKGFYDEIEKLVDNKDDLQLRSFLESVLNPPQKNEEADGNVKQQDKEKYKASLPEIQKSLEVLTEYIRYHSESTTNDIGVLLKWSDLISERKDSDSESDEDSDTGSES